MTILEILNNRNTASELMDKAFAIIKDNFTSLINDNYELIINQNKELIVKIPSLEKKNEYVYKSIGEYQYPLVMCMRISGIDNDEEYNYILAKFMELYKDKLELFIRDVNRVEKLMDKIKKTKNYIDYITYASLALLISALISLCIFTRMSQTVKSIVILGMILFSAISLIGQFTKENQVKKVVDAYISMIKTEWYQKELIREYAFLCNFIG